LVEFDGQPVTARLTVPGPVASARKATTRGDMLADLTVTPAPAPLPELGGEWAMVQVDLRPYEIATVYLDLVPGRKVSRDLDAHRNVWATVHRVAE
jgi:alpha-mannosidase